MNILFTPIQELNLLIYGSLLVAGIAILIMLFVIIFKK